MKTKTQNREETRAARLKEQVMGGGGHSLKAKKVWHTNREVTAFNSGGGGSGGQRDL